MYYTIFRYSMCSTKSARVTTRIISTVVSVFMSCMMILYIFDWISVCVWLSLQYILSSYILFDLFIIHAYDDVYASSDWSIILHHLVTYPVVHLYILGFFPTWYVWAYAAEFSTPFLNLSWYLLHTKKTSSGRSYRKILLAINSCIVVVLFIVFRVLNYIYLLWLSIVGYHAIPICVLTVYTVLNILWTRLLIRKVRSSL